MKVVQDKNHFRTPGHMTEVRNNLRRKVPHPKGYLKRIYMREGKKEKKTMR
jgi:hypothetical protein